MSKSYWLMKTEPDVFSFEDLIAMKNSTDHWDGIRNYQARNMMRDNFKKGDQVLIYHSNATPPGIAGMAEVVKEAYPDHTALDESCKYYDPKSAEKGESRWVMVDVKATHRLKNFLPLPQLKEMKELDGMALLKKGQRLSIQPVSKEEWAFIKKLAKPQKL